MTTEADTCRKNVVPICLGGGGSLFCGLQTLAFSFQPFLSRRSVTKTEALVSVLGKFGGADQLVRISVSCRVV
jgi:hypothetical protein